MINMLKSWVLVTPFVFTVASQANTATPEEQAQAQLLSSARQFIQFPRYTNEEKQTIANQAQRLLSIYVNRENKKILYGDAVDAIPRINAIQRNAIQLSDADLHTQIQEVFESQRDLHLNYFYPRPHSCFVASQLFSLKEIYSPTQERKAVISNVLTNFSDLVPAITNLQLGDEIVSIDNQSLETLVDSLIVEGAGANNFAGFKRALAKVTFRTFRSDTLPSDNQVTYTFKRASNGSEYQISLPWISVGDETCLEASLSDGTNTNTVNFAVNDPLIALTENSQDDFQKQYNAHFGKPALSNSNFSVNPTIDTTIQWGLLNNSQGRFGYLSLSSMVPATGIVGGVEIISNLLTNELSDTDGLIIDIRDNGGGFIVYAEILPQLFSPEFVEPYKKRALKAELNELIFVDLALEGDDWKNAYEDIIGTSATYTQPIEITSLSFANDFMGQLYFKPVAVLTNAACYSACDLLAGLMQDFGNSTLWGEDLLTGAGGANVIGFNGVLINAFQLDNLPESGIQALPGGQDMRVAWRQTIRTGDSENRVIEDLGVSVERRARPTVADIQGNTQSQFDRIASDLNYQSYDKEGSIIFEQDGRFLLDDTIGQLFLGYEIDVDASLTLKTQVFDTDQINVYVNGSKVNTLSVFSGSQGKTLNISLPATAFETGKAFLKLEGINFGDVSWRVNRLINKIE
ncbi:MAG: S41 family peptidase [Pseudomonadota bacterium]